MADIGTTLREARMRARIDISEVEARTKIRAKYLRAIENEEWDLLPGPVYVKSFLRTYGDYLGLDSRLLIDEFRRRYERPADHDLRPLASVRRERERASRGPLVPPRVIIGVILLIVVVVLYVIGAGSSDQPKPSPTGANATVGHRGHHRSAASPGSVTTATTGTTATTPTTTTRPATASRVRLELVPTGAVSVCVADRRGHKLIAGVIYQAGQTIPTETRGELLVTLGNNAVQMKVNGKLVPIAASSAAIDLKITPSGVTPLPAAQAPC
jgi:cytoskeleton protein RodZ